MASKLHIRNDISVQGITKGRHLRRRINTNYRSIWLLPFDPEISHFRDRRLHVSSLMRGLGRSGIDFFSHLRDTESRSTRESACQSRNRLSPSAIAPPPSQPLPTPLPAFYSLAVVPHALALISLAFQSLRSPNSRSVALLPLNPTPPTWHPR